MVLFTPKLKSFHPRPPAHPASGTRSGASGKAPSMGTAVMGALHQFAKITWLGK